MVGPGVLGVPTAVGAVLVLMLFLAFLLFTISLMLHRDHCHLLHVKLAANCIIGHLPTATLLHPASISMYLLGKQISTAYCWFYLQLQCVAEMFTPYALLMFSIERMMYIRNPTAHVQKITRAGAITFIAFPWVISVLVAILDVSITTKRVETHHYFEESHRNYTVALCSREMRAHHIAVEIVFRILSGGLIPIATCVVIVTVLVMWCCFKRKMSLGTDYDMLGEEVTTKVYNSVIAVAVPNFLIILILIGEVATQIHLRYRLFAVVSLFGLIEGIVWILTLGEVRMKFAEMLKSCCLKEVPAVQEENLTPSAISAADENEDAILYRDTQALPI